MVDMKDYAVQSAMYVLLLSREKAELFNKGTHDFAAYEELAEANVDLEIMRMAREIREEVGKYDAELSVNREVA